MSAASLGTLPAQSEAQFRRLIAAELLKLSRRRTLLIASVALIVAPMLVSFIVLAILHAANPAKYGPAGGVDNLRGALRLLTQIGTVAAVLIGVNAGGSDLAAGVFRELVVTGRSRLALFAARIPGGLALLLPAVAVAFAIAATASVTLAGPGKAPGPRLLLEYSSWRSASPRCSTRARPRSAFCSPGSSPSPRCCSRPGSSTRCCSAPRSSASNRARAALPSR